MIAAPDQSVAITSGTAFGAGNDGLPHGTGSHLPPPGMAGRGTILSPHAILVVIVLVTPLSRRAGVSRAPGEGRTAAELSDSRRQAREISDPGGGDQMSSHAPPPCLTGVHLSWQMASSRSERLGVAARPADPILDGAISQRALSPSAPGCDGDDATKVVRRLALASKVAR